MLGQTGQQGAPVSEVNAADGSVVMNLVIDVDEFSGVMFESAHAGKYSHTARIGRSLFCLLQHNPLMHITVNGQAHDLPPALTVAGLIEHLSLLSKRIAVERNGEVVPRSRHAGTALNDGDRLEIIVAVGGG